MAQLPDDGTVEIHGRLPDAEKSKIRQWALPAIQELGLDPVRIRCRHSWRSRRFDATAWAWRLSPKQVKRVWLNPRLLGLDPSYLGFVVCEQIANHKLDLGGGSPNFHLVLVQSCFARWFAYRRVVSADPTFADRMPSWLLPEPAREPTGMLIPGQMMEQIREKDADFGGQLGALTGMAAAGNPAAVARLKSWSHRSQLGYGEERDSVACLERVFETCAEPATVAQRLAELYRDEFRHRSRP